MGEDLNKLEEYMYSLPKGPVENTSKVESLLCQAWDESGDEDEYGGLKSFKIIGRLEDVRWNPPYIYFTIERHGAMMYGSSRAQLQDWGFNVEDGSASFTSTRYRQICKRASPLRTKPLAEKIGKLIYERQDNEMLKWFESKSVVQIMIGRVIPDDTAKETVFKRRKRFRRDLTDFLKNYGWEPVRPNRYKFSGSS